MRKHDTVHGGLFLSEIPQDKSYGQQFGYSMVDGELLLSFLNDTQGKFSETSVNVPSLETLQKIIDVLENCKRVFEPVPASV